MKGYFCIRQHAHDGYGALRDLSSMCQKALCAGGHRKKADH